MDPAHRRWLARQQFEHPESELAFADYLATVDAAAARKAALAERLSRLAQEPDLWPTVARLRAEKRVTRPQVGTGELHHAHVLITTAALLPLRRGTRGERMTPLS